MGFHRFTYAVFGAMADKDIAGVVAQLKGRIDHWCVTDLPLTRAASAESIRQVLLDAGVSEGTEPDAESSLQCFSSPEKAFFNASGRAEENDRIAVFGSFLTVAGVMAAKKSGFH